MPSVCSLLWKLPRVCLLDGDETQSVEIPKIEMWKCAPQTHKATNPSVHLRCSPTATGWTANFDCLGHCEGRRSIPAVTSIPMLQSQFFWRLWHVTAPSNWIWLTQLWKKNLLMVTNGQNMQLLPWFCLSLVNIDRHEVFFTNYSTFIFSFSEKKRTQVLLNLKHPRLGLHIAKTPDLCANPPLLWPIFGVFFRSSPWVR